MILFYIMRLPYQFSVIGHGCFGSLDFHLFILRFAADGVSFSLSTDDPGVIQCNLTGEYDMAETQLGLSTQQIMQSVCRSYSNCL